MDESIISISDVLAVLVRKGKQIICCGIVFAILFGGFKGFTIWRNLNNEEYINWDHISYEQEKKRLEDAIEEINRNLVNQEEYLANSLWMDINPYDKHVAEVYLMISGIDEHDINMTFGDTTTPTDYLMNKIVSQYSILWPVVDLPNELHISEYENVMDKYVRELVSVDFLDGGIIRISAIGNTEDEASKLADRSAELLMERLELVKQNSFNHVINKFNTINQTQIDYSMAETQRANYEQVEDYKVSIIKTKVDMMKLEEPESVLVSVVKMIAIGGILGSALACVWYLGKMFMMDTLQSSAHMERSMSVPFAGTLVKQKGLADRLSSLCSGERVWKDEEQALDYIVEMVKLRLPGKKLLLASSLDLAKHADAVEKLKKALTAAGIQVNCADDVLHYPGTPDAFKGCDGVLLLEQMDHTKVNQVRQICCLSKECEKNIIGFALV